MKPSKNVRTKIAVGYALIIVVCILSVGYVYRQVERFTGPDDSRMQVQSRRSLVNQTLYHLYQAEGYGQFLIAGYPSYERGTGTSCRSCANTSIRSVRGAPSEATRCNASAWTASRR